jgi:uncharacterized RDD family membrane protein YckC
MPAPAAYAGNTALAIDPWASRSPNESLNETSELPLWQTQKQTAAISPDQKVIPFTTLQRQAGIIPTPPPPAPPVSAPPVWGDQPPQRTAVRRSKPSGPPVEQGSLDFVQVPAAPTRTLTGEVPAAVFCARPVATPAHRFFAAVVDVSMILIGFGLFVGAVQLTGVAMGIPGILGSGKLLLGLLGAAFVMMTAFYGMLWPMARRETCGMRMAGLTLITFDGAEVDPATRLVRVLSTWLSLGAGGLGVIWAMADEEKLTWQDHISKTFPTFRESGDSFVRHQR